MADVVEEVQSEERGDREVRPLWGGTTRRTPRVCRLLGKRLDANLLEQLQIGRQLVLAFLVAALAQEERQDAGVLLRLEAF